MPSPSEIGWCILFCAPSCFALEQLGKFIYRKIKQRRAK